MEILGILNVTPDSFSDGGKWDSEQAALGRGLELVEDGATIVDIGGESTRPGATPISSEEEWSRIGSVITNLLERDMQVSVDTYHAETARRAIDAGVPIINDVTGGRVEPEIHDVVADSDALYVLQHSRGGAVTTNDTAQYDSIIDDIAAEMSVAIEKAVAKGITQDRIILDPGLGFSKVGDQDWEVLRGLDRLMGLLPGRWLIGHSRKRFLASVSDDRDLATALVTSQLVGRVWGVRVHDAKSSAAATRIVRKIHG